VQFEKDLNKKLKINLTQLQSDEVNIGFTNKTLKNISQISRLLSIWQGYINGLFWGNPYNNYRNTRANLSS